MRKTITTNSEYDMDAQTQVTIRSFDNRATVISKQADPIAVRFTNKHRWQVVRNGKLVEGVRLTPESQSCGLVFFASGYGVTRHVVVTFNEQGLNIPECAALAAWKLCSNF